MRDCNKCIHHISGSCDAWECDMQTLEEHDKQIRANAIDEFVKSLYKIGEHREFDWEDIYRLADRLKAGGENE